MGRGLLRLLKEREEEGLTPEDISSGIEAVQAQISSLRSQKRFYMKVNTPSARERWGEADEEEQMLKRLLAEYRLLSGDRLRDE